MSIQARVYCATASRSVISPSSLSPRREGNTRSLRAFLGQLAAAAGHRVDWEHLDHKQSLAVNVQSLNGKNEQLRELLDNILDRS
jgi:cell filamentation protein